MVVINKLILNWFDSHGRKDLPWQKNKTPYRVWISEIMLQQTQVNTVIPYFKNFIKKFPDIFSLAESSEDDVLHCWTGLGYYSRARNLHRAAKIIVDEHRGIFPNTLAELQLLPGIGRSTAGAILAIALGIRAAILDGNVKRVLTRLHAITDWPGEKKITEQLWVLAEKYTPKNRVADYTQAIMDIGATVCVRGKPRCEICPLKKYCLALHQGIEKKLPRAKPKKILPIRQMTALIFQKNKLIFLEKRPPTGIWGSLWSFPEITGVPSIQDIEKTCRQRFRFTTHQIDLGKSFRHTFSHFHLDITPAFIMIQKPNPRVHEDDQFLWYNPNTPAMIGLPAPIKKLLRSLTV